MKGQGGCSLAVKEIMLELAPEGPSLKNLCFLPSLPSSPSVVEFSSALHCSSLAFISWNCWVEIEANLSDRRRDSSDPEG